MKIVITDEQIDQWRQQQAQLHREMQRIQAEIESVTRKIEAVKLFAGEENSELFPESNPLQEPNPPQAVLQVVRDSGTRLKPREIRSRLAAAGYDMGRFGASGNYFYSVLKRLVDSGRIKTRNGRYYVEDYLEKETAQR